MSRLHIHINNKTYSTAGRTAAKAVIADFDLTLANDEFVCLVGPSGCGKTTLLNIIAGLDKAYEGAIVNESALQSPKIGYVFQNPRLLPWRTVRENIELVLNPQQMSNVDDLLEVMQLTAAQHAYPERLSLGMSRRVAIIRAFAINPDLLLMDEPFVSLDAPTARQVRELLLNLWQHRPHSVLFVTHDLREAIALADKLVFLSAAPMAVVRTLTVPIPRQQRHDEAAIESFRQQLKAEYPDINMLL